MMSVGRIHPRVIVAAQKRIKPAEIAARQRKIQASPALFLFEQGHGSSLFSSYPSDFQLGMVRLEGLLERFNCVMRIFGLGEKEVQELAAGYYKRGAIDPGVIDNLELTAEFVGKIKSCNRDAFERISKMAVEVMDGQNNIRGILQAVLKELTEFDGGETIAKVIGQYSGDKRRILLIFEKGTSFVKSILLSEEEIADRVKAFEDIEITNRGRSFFPFVNRDDILRLIVNVSPQKAKENILFVDDKYNVSEEIFMNGVTFARRKVTSKTIILYAHVVAASRVFQEELDGAWDGIVEPKETQRIIKKAQGLYSKIKNKKSLSARLFRKQRSSFNNLVLAERACLSGRYDKAKEYYVKSYLSCMNDHSNTRDVIGGLEVFSNAVARRLVDYYFHFFDFRRQGVAAKMFRIKSEAAYVDDEIGRLGAARRLRIEISYYEAILRIYNEINNFRYNGSGLNTLQSLYLFSMVFDKEKSPFVFSDRVRDPLRKRIIAYMLDRTGLSRDEAKKMFSGKSVYSPLSYVAADYFGLYFGTRHLSNRFTVSLKEFCSRYVDLKLLPKSSAVLFEAARKTGILEVEKIHIFMPQEQLAVARTMLRAHSGEGRFCEGMVSSAKRKRFDGKSQLAKRFYEIKSGYLG